jgi:hypothetical protein
MLHILLLLIQCRFFPLLILLFREFVPLCNLEEKCRCFGVRAVSIFKVQELSSGVGGTVFSEKYSKLRGILLSQNIEP